LRELCDAHRDLRVHEAVHDVHHQHLALQDTLMHELRLNVELHEYYGEAIRVYGEAIHEGLEHE
jgi:hypothetical protein